MDERTLEFFQRVIDRGSIQLSNGKNSRYTVMYEGHFFSVSKIVYYLFNPKAKPLGPDEEIHHRDHDRLNDHPDNLMRVTHKWHVEHHRSCIKYLPDWPSPGWVSPILVNQMKQLWLSGMRRVSDIWKTILKVVDRASVRIVVLYHQKRWAAELKKLSDTPISISI